MRRLIYATLLAAAVAVAACGVTDPSQNKTDTYNGQVTAGNQSTQNFSVSTSGEITVTITNLQPTLSVGQYFGVALGQQSSGNCSIFGVPNGFGVVNAAVISSAIQPGSWCVILYDVGFFKANTTYNYTMTISHP